jgi:hypothetical protein
MANPCVARYWFPQLSDTHTRLWVVSLNARDGHMRDTG